MHGKGTVTNMELITETEERALLANRPHTCFFTGHRDIAKEVRPVLSELLEAQTESLYLQGFDTFLCGGARGFDLYAASAVLSLCREHPDVHLIMVLPCSNQTARWQPDDRDFFRSVCAEAECVLLSGQYTNGCMQRRNRFLVDHAAAGLAYYTGASVSGTAQTLRYAKQNGIFVINLADMLTQEEQAYT